MAATPSPSVRAVACASWNRFHLVACCTAGWSAICDVGPCPEVVEPRPLLVEDLGHAELDGPVEGAVAAVDELARGHRARRVVRDHLGDADRLALLGVHPVDVLGEVVADRARLGELVLGRDRVLGGDGDRHARVGGLVAEHVARALRTLHARLQHPLVELLGLARVESRRRLGDARPVLVAAVLAVEDLARDGHRGIRVEQFDLVVEHGEVAVGERHHAPARDEHPLARRGAPLDRAAQRAEAEVEAALIGEELGHGEHERLVVDVEADHLRVGRVHDRLPDPREAERLLGVPDGPRLVEAVHERAVHVAVAALLDVAAQAEVAVADGEERLGASHVGDAEVGLDERPLVDGEPAAVQRVVVGEPHEGSSRVVLGWGNRGRMPRRARRVGSGCRGRTLDRGEQLVELVDDRRRRRAPRAPRGPRRGRRR